MLMCATKICKSNTTLFCSKRKKREKIPPHDFWDINARLKKMTQIPFTPAIKIKMQLKDASAHCKEPHMYCICIYTSDYTAEVIDWSISFSSPPLR